MKMSQAYLGILVVKLAQSGLLNLGLVSCCFFMGRDAAAPHIGTVLKNEYVLWFSQSIKKGSDGWEDGGI